MKSFLRFVFFCCAVIVISAVTACSPITTLSASKVDGYEAKLQKVMVVTVAKENYIREQFENVLANQLADRGVETVASYKIFPNLGLHVDPMLVFTKAEGMGASHIMVAKSVHEEKVRNIQSDGYTYGYVATFSENSAFYGQGFFKTYRAYDSTYYNVIVNIYDVDQKRNVWSYLSQIKVAGSPQKAINQFIPTVISQLQETQLF